MRRFLLCFSNQQHIILLVIAEVESENNVPGDETNAKLRVVLLVGVSWVYTGVVQPLSFNFF